MTTDEQDHLRDLTRDMQRVLAAIHTADTLEEAMRQAMMMQRHCISIQSLCEQRMRILRRDVKELRETLYTRGRA